MRHPFMMPICLILPACQPASAPPAPTELLAATCAALPATSDDPAWARAGEFPAALLPQDMVEPRQLESTTMLVRVRALCDDRRVAFRLEWDDATRNDEQRPGAFSDACAVQLPATITADVPAPQMGEPGKDVEIVFWRATWQAALAEGALALHDLYPNASVDHYPFEVESAAGAEALALRYAPARALENDVAVPRTTSVEVLVASGPGTLRPAPLGDAAGAGLRTESGWSVVLSRALPEGFGRFARSQVAFAVWDGAAGEVGARKMRTVWVPLGLEVRP